jgi:peptidoglycan/LPS O-acetylase OafA/YrhL
MTHPLRVAVIPSLDGFRALSIIIVVLSHCGLGDIVPGGLGVTIFFFLSGFLISSLLLQEYDSHDAINIRHFYLRRVLRLYPPLLVTLCIAYTLVYLGKLGGGESTGGLLAQLFYFANYYQLFFDDGNGIPDGTGILWSLAVEEHFYLVYPLVFVGLVRHGRGGKAVFMLAGLCMAALLWRCHLISQPGFQPARTYYSSDTRFDSILFGCILAFLRLDAKKAVADSPMTFKQWLLFSAGVAGIAVTLLYRNESFRESFRYTIQGVCLIPIFHFAVTYPANPIFSILNVGVIRRIGVYSYSIYLIHFVIESWLQRNWHVTVPHLVLFASVFAISCGYAYVVERFVDSRFRAMRKRLH